MRANSSVDGWLGAGEIGAAEHHQDWHGAAGVRGKHEHHMDRDGDRRVARIVDVADEFFRYDGVAADCLLVDCPDRPVDSG